MTSKSTRTPPPLPPRPRPFLPPNNNNNDVKTTRKTPNLVEATAGVSSVDRRTTLNHPRHAALAQLTRQASLPGEDPPSSINSSKLSAGVAMASPTKKLLAKKLVRMNSDSDLHIQHMSKEEESVLDTLDEIDLLHNIAKTPNLLNDGASSPSRRFGGIYASAATTTTPANNLLQIPGAPSTSSSGTEQQQSPNRDKRKLMKQKSLNRTLSTSVLRIKKKRCTFWNT